MPSPPHPNPLPQGEREPEVPSTTDVIAISTVLGPGQAPVTGQCHRPELLNGIQTGAAVSRFNRVLHGWLGRAERNSYWCSSCPFERDPERLVLGPISDQVSNRDHAGRHDSAVWKIYAAGCGSSGMAHKQDGAVRAPRATQKHWRRSRTHSDLNHHFHGFRMPHSGMPVLWQFGGWSTVTAVRLRAARDEDRPDE